MEEAELRSKVQSIVDRVCLRMKLTALVLRGGTRKGAAARRVTFDAVKQLLPLLNSPQHTRLYQK